jgi:hypothetical protein
MLIKMSIQIGYKRETYETGICSKTSIFGGKLKMIYIEALNELESECDYTWPRVFLAGGITGCPDWQALVVQKLKDVDIVVFNPRRKNFPINDPMAAKAQIKWEYEHFRKSTCIMFLFWFAAETVQPIVLFELGTWSMYNKIGHGHPGRVEIVIGCDPKYPRLTDVIEQIPLLCPGMSVFDNLGDVVIKIKQHVKNWECTSHRWDQDIIT